jgi:hypothetical protein
MLTRESKSSLAERGSDGLAKYGYDMLGGAKVKPDLLTWEGTPGSLRLKIATVETAIRHAVYILLWGVQRTTTIPMAPPALAIRGQSSPLEPRVRAFSTLCGRRNHEIYGLWRGYRKSEYVHFPERRAGDARGRGRRVGRAVRGTWLRSPDRPFARDQFRSTSKRGYRRSGPPVRTRSSWTIARLTAELERLARESSEISKKYA